MLYLLAIKIANCS